MQTIQGFMTDEPMAVAAISRDNRSLPSWCGFLLGGLVTFLAVYAGISRPAARQMELMRFQLSQLEQQLTQLSEQAGGVQQTNSLLATLAEQRLSSQQAAQAVRDIQRLHRDLIAEGDDLYQTADAIAQFSGLKHRLLRAADRVRDAEQVALASDGLHQRLVDMEPIVLTARRASEDLLALEDELLSRSGDFLVAKRTLEKLWDIRDQVHQLGCDLDLTRDRVDGLLALKDQIMDHTDNVDKARDTLDRSESIQQEFEQHVDQLDADLAMTRDRMEGLITLKERALEGTSDLAAALETLELTSDLREQFFRSAGYLEQMRHWLVEFVAMQPLVDKALSTLQPLTELANLRRLDPDHLRQVARFLSGQGSAMAQSGASAGENSVSTTDTDEVRMTTAPVGNTQ